MSNVSPAIARFLALVADVGPRWGIAATPCRVHGLLYLRATPMAEDELSAALGISATELQATLDFLKGFNIIEQRTDGRWQTFDDPWVLMMRALEVRRHQETGPAMAALQACHAQALSDHGLSSPVTRQIAKIRSLVDDLSAIEMPRRRRN